MCECVFLFCFRKDDLMNGIINDDQGNQHQSFDYEWDFVKKLKFSELFAFRFINSIMASV